MPFHAIHCIDIGVRARVRARVCTHTYMRSPSLVSFSLSFFLPGPQQRTLVLDGFGLRLSLAPGVARRSTLHSTP